MKKVYELLKKYYIFSLVILIMGNAAGAFAQPTADAGPNATICENQTIELSDATASNFDALLWTTSGDGTWSDETALNPIYYPGDSDGNSVILTLTASAAGFPDAVSSMTLTLTQLPVPYAGEDATICGGNDYPITSASITGPYNFFSWNAGFDGTFNPSPFVIDPTYVPGTLDLLNGEVTINLVVTPESPCVAIQSANFVLTFSDEINADAGADAEICEGETYQLNGSTSNATSSSWSTDGDGSFDDPSALDAIYTPGTDDITLGSVTLTLTANNQFCDPDSDDMILTINPLPEPDCPVFGPVCEGSAFIDFPPVTGGVYTDAGNNVVNGFDPVTQGTYSFTLTVTNQFNCSASCGFEIVVNPLPQANCPVIDPVCEGDDVITFPVIMGGVYTDVNNNIVTEFDPTTAGTYDFTLTVTNQFGCSASCSFSIVVNPNPVADCPVIDPVCEGDDVIIFPLVTGGVYTDVNNNVVTEFDPTTAGTYGFTLTVTNQFDCTASCNFEILVNPVPGVQCPVIDPVCEGSGFITFPTVTDGVYTDANNMVVTGIDPVTAGTYGFTLTVTNQFGCSSSCDFDVVVNPNPDADCPVIDPVCEGDDVIIFPAVPGGVYTDENSNVVTEFDPTTAGTYGFTLTVTNQFDCTASCDFEILVNPVPGVQCPVIDPVCEGSGFITFPTVTDGVYTDANNVVVTGFDPVTAGTYGFTLTVTNQFGCSSSCDFDVVVNPNPDANCPVIDPVCEGDAVITFPAVPGGVYTDANNNVVTEFDPTIAGTYDFTLTVTNQFGCSASCSFSIVVNPNPVADCPVIDPVCEGDDVITFPLVPGGVYTDANNNVVTGFNPDAAGTFGFTLTVTDQNGCSASCNFDVVVNPLPELTDLTLQGAIAGPQPVFFPLSGDLANGFGMCLNDDENTHYWLDVNTLISTESLEIGFMNPFFHTAQVPGDFFTYWAGRGVVAGATGWQGVMWEIINGNLPVFYLVYDGSDYTLIDGLQYQNVPSETLPLVLPGNYPRGDYDFSGTIKDVNGCVSEDITVGITFGHEAFADAGEDQTVCVGVPVQLDATVENDCSIQWVPVSASGTFSNENEEDPIYTPGTLDYIIGFATLSINVTACDPCTELASDLITIYFDDPPVAEAGDNATICEDGSWQLNGSVENACGQEWSTSGDGNFDDPGSLTATYTPGPIDIDNEFVQLTLTAEGCGTCPDDTDFMTLSIQKGPTVDILFNDSLVCEGTVFDFANLVTYSDKSAVIWFTGNGSNNWDDNEIDFPKYTVSQLDAAQGVIDITVSVIGVDPCSNAFADDNCTLTIQLQPLVDAGEDKTVCENNSIELDDAAAQQFSSLLWTSTYPDDIFSDPTVLNPTFTPGQQAIDAGETFLTLTAGPVDPCTTGNSSTIKVTIQDLPVVEAGDNATICEDGNYQLSGSATNVCGTPAFEWTSDGTGTFDDPNSLTAVYTPSAGDILDGAATLTLTGYPCLPCVDNVSDNMTLTFQLLPEVDAGADADVCESGFFLLEATASNYSAISWITLGDGTFDNNLLLNPTYYPGTGDAASGTVTLEVTAFAIGPCNQSVTDDITLSVQPLPIADAGLDDTACETGYTFQPGSVAVFNNSNLEWTTNGDGTFDIAMELLTTYYPGSGDVGAGIVTLTLVANPINPCVISDQDDMNLTILESATVDAGDDATICDTDTYELSGATASDYETLSWSTDGDGSFSDPDAVNPTYIPGSGDISAGSVELCLSATSVDPCTAITGDCMTLTIQGSPTADAGSDGVLCETGGDISGTATNFDYVEWTTDGDGTFADANELMTTYFPGGDDVTTGTVTLTLTAYPINPPCLGEASDDVTFTIQVLPLANAGPDVTICETGTSQLNGSVQNACGSFWTGGDGTFDDATSLTATYTPGPLDLAAGSATLTLTAVACAPCDQDDTDEVVIFFQVAPESYAGEDGTFCEDAIFLNDATVANNVSILWTTSGDGTFSNPAILTPQYFPGDDDKNFGQVTLTITATPILPCDVAAKDDIVITIILNPVVADLDDATICEGDTYTIPTGPTPTAENYSAISWTTSGNGTFDDESSENPTYTPSQDDIDGGSVDLCINVTPINPCVLDLQECMTLTIQKLPTVFAGDDDTSCGLEPFTLSEATAENYQAVLWTTSGDGTFDDDESVNPTYYPGLNDQSNLSVTLTISASPIAPCVGPSVEDQIVIFIQLSPTANAGPDVEICENESYQLINASAQNNNGQLWSIIDGDGTFDDVTALNPTYTPGPGDIADGFVELCLVALAQAPCTVNSDPDCMILSFAPLPAADAGDDGVVCENESYQISGASVTNASGQLWSTTGDGSFSDASALNPIYYPGMDDINDGTVDLCLVALPTAPCTTNSDPDCMTLTIQYLPIADAGGDATTCANEPYQLNGSVQYSTSYLWSTSGDGTFDDQSLLMATYFPSDDDLNDGNVTLTLTAAAEPPCTGGDVSSMLLTFDPEPAVIFANEDGQFYQDATLTYCFDETVTITLDEILSGAAPFDFGWDIFEGGNLVDNGSATGVGLGGELFSNTYPAGEYTVELTSMEDANGCSPTDISVYTVNIVVNPQPNPFFTIDDDPLLPGGVFDYCYDVTEIILALVEEQGGQNSVGTPPFDISISINGGTNIDFNGVNFGDEIDLLTYTSTTPGTYNIQVTSLVDDNGCAIPTTVLENYYFFTVNIHEEPALIFAANGTQFYEGATLEYCEGETVTISLDEVLSGEGPFDIAWTVDGAPDNATVNLGDNLFSGQLAAGTYPIQITSIVDANDCEPSDYAPYNATVIVSPPPALIFAANGQQFYEGDVLEFCEGDNIEVTLDEIVLGTAPFSISWTVNGSPETQTGVNLGDALFSGTQPVGTYDIVITNITDANGCSPLDVSMYNATFIVNPEPTLAITLDGTTPAPLTEYCWNDDFEICLTGVNGTPDWTVEWLVTGPSGPFGDVMTGTSECFPYNAADFLPGTYDLTIVSLTDAKGCETSQTTLDSYAFQIEILPEPTLEITLDGDTPAPITEYCWNDDFEICLAGVVGTPDWTVEWLVTGPSGPFGDVMTGTSECFPYNAADFLPGTYDLTIVSLTDADGCSTSQATLDTYAFQIEILPEPTLLVTLDGVTPDPLNQYCDTESFEICLEGVVGTPDWTVEWAVTGPSGPFGDVMTGTSECWSYNAADFLPGIYDLTIVSLTDAKGCAASTATLDAYAFQIEIVASPTVDAGENGTICEGGDFPLSSATADNFSSLLWSHNGAGDFDDPTILNPTYMPGAGDVGITVTLFLVAQPNAPCANIASDFVTLFVQPAPTANAGADATICEDGDFLLADATAANFSSTDWDSDGLGAFDDESLVNATYTPDAGDVGNTVTLCLTAEPVDPCDVAAEDCMELFIQPKPTAFSGNDATIQSDETYTLSEATATNFSGLLWETSGDGTFDDNGALQPTYTPGLGDKINGEVLLTLTAFGIDPCGIAMHNMLLTIEGVPPTVEITSPLDGTFFNFSPITVEGVASDLDGFVDFVEVRVNGGPWQLATGTDNWTIEVQLDPCLNTIEARATDTQGLQSDIDQVTEIKLNGQLIEMVQGWSYISSYIDATDPNFFTLEDYIVPQNNLIIMLNEDGLIFWPSEDINTLVEWDTQFGYKVKNNFDGTWLLAGENTPNQTITLNPGPNIFPVLTNVDYPLPGDFNDEDILIIFELQTARIYWPDGGLFTLTELKPGFGYLGNFFNQFSITYPDYVDCELKSGSSDVEYVTNVSPWELERTASVHFISITNEAVAELDNAEFIGAFDASGMCIGYADVREKADNYLLTVYGDESVTDAKDGAAVGEAINLVAYNGAEEQLVAKYDMSMPNFDGRFANSGMSKITSFKEAPAGIGDVAISEMIRIFPNPATDQVNIYYPVSDGFSTAVKVTFTSASGSVVLTEDLTREESQVDISNLQPGVYFVKFESNGNTAVKRLVIK